MIDFLMSELQGSSVHSNCSHLLYLCSLFVRQSTSAFICRHTHESLATQLPEHLTYSCAPRASDLPITNTRGSFTVTIRMILPQYFSDCMHVDYHIMILVVTT